MTEDDLSKSVAKNFKLVFLGVLILLVAVIVTAAALEAAHDDASNLWNLASLLAGGLIGLIGGKASN